MDELDMLIVGAGTAEQTAAFDLVAAGYRIAVVEKSGKAGGVCALFSGVSQIITVPMERRCLYCF